MQVIDTQFLETLWHDSRQMARHLQREGHVVSCKRIPRLMTTMVPVSIYQRSLTTVPNPEHQVFLYLLRDLFPTSAYCLAVDLPTLFAFC